MAKNAIDDNGVLYLYNKIKGDIPTHVSDLTNDANYQTALEVATAINTAIGGLSIPAKVSDLSNDANYQSDTQVQDAINTAIAGIDNLHFDWSHQELPQTGESNVIYAIPTGDTSDPYDFYVWNSTSSTFVKLDFEIDMSGYMKTSDIHWMTNAEIDALLD